MKLSLTLVALSILASTAAFAGASNAELRCKARDGLTIEGNIPGDFSEFDMTVAKGGKSANFFNRMDQDSEKVETNARLDIVQSVENGVWTLKMITQWAKGIEDESAMEIFALPKSVKYKRTRNGFQSSFKAKGSYLIPAVGGGNWKELNLSCTLVHEI